MDLFGIKKKSLERQRRTRLYRFIDTLLYELPEHRSIQATYDKISANKDINFGEAMEIYPYLLLKHPTERKKLGPSCSISHPQCLEEIMKILDRS